jgi:S-DNA-T family DNA segregation ATPase FtsK/SpoIIIE
MPASNTRLLNDRSAEAPAFAIRVPVRLVGALVLFAVAYVLTALASWQVNDPSLSYAAGYAPDNLLGAPGAIIADVLFQTFGLAALVAILPPAVWGWRLTQRSMPPRFLMRAITWLTGTVLIAGVFACIAAPATWPLPTGLGGLAGEGFFAISALVTGIRPEGLMALVYGALFAAPAVSLLWIAAGLKASAMTRPASDPLLDENAPERTGLFDVALGAVMHSAFTFRTAWRRARTRFSDRRPEIDPDWTEDRAPVEPRFNAASNPTGPMERREPVLSYDDPIAEPDYDDVEYDDYDEDTAPPLGDSVARLIVESGHNSSPRVSAPARRAKPGARQSREAQGSLLDESGFDMPPLDLLTEPSSTGVIPEHQPEHLEANARRLESVLEDFGVKGDIINVRPGPVVTLYELEPAPGIKSSRVISLADDIARSMSAISARVAVVPGRNAIGIELPNKTRETVFLREMLGSADFEKMKGKLPICLGKTIGGEPVIADLARMPHLLIAGTTGSGKSVAVNTMILSLLYRMTPEQCRLIMIDPKMLELSSYDGIPHLLTPVVTDPSKAVVALKWAVREMEDRYKKMSKVGVRNIDGFNQRIAEARRKGEIITRTVQTGFDRETGEPVFESEEFDLSPLPYIVVIVDEMADLMMVAGKDIEGAIQRLAQMARASGIHLIMATQRPSVDVITGTIKANFPTRISFQVTSKIDSRTILGEQGAEQLLGMGDMLYMVGGGRIKRLHGPFVSDDEVEDVVGHLKRQGVPDYLDSITEEEDPDDAMYGDDFGGSGDELYDKAVNIVLNDRKASTSYIQRRLSVGYNKAATLIERMEKEGVVSPANHVGKREILVGEDVY